MTTGFESHYVTMPDGVQLAIDVHMPQQASERPVPTILHQTRYFRSIAMRWPFRWIKLPQAMDSGWTTRQRFLDAGYAWIDVCVRGSGASFGTRPCPWSREETTDGVNIVDWITQQSWSNGMVGATGISYSGTAAEWLLSEQPKALKAVAPRFSVFDVYTDVAFPGGMHLEWFTKAWGKFNAMLDQNDLGGALALNIRMSSRGFSQMAQGFYRTLFKAGDSRFVERLLRWITRALSPGVLPVDADPQGRQVQAAAQVHQTNYDVHAGAEQLTYRDDTGISDALPNATIDAFSPHTVVGKLRESGVAVLNCSGWLDGGYPYAAIKRHTNLSPEQSQLILGPWNHGGHQDISPFTPPQPTDFDHDSVLLAFFDTHLKENTDTAHNNARVRYFTLGEEQWKTAEQWPPTHARMQPYYLSNNLGFDPALPLKNGADSYQVNLATNTGDRARWNSLLSIKAPIGYGDFQNHAKTMLCYTSAPLTQSVEITGHPIVHLFFECDQDDAALFVYLLDVMPNGQSTYITEGILRAQHRKISDAKRPYQAAGPYRTFYKADAMPLIPGEPAELVFDMLPISYRVAEGHAISVAIAGADSTHFAPISTTPPKLNILWGGAQPSRIELPVCPTS